MDLCKLRPFMRHDLKHSAKYTYTESIRSSLYTVSDVFKGEIRLQEMSF